MHRLRPTPQRAPSTPRRLAFGRLARAGWLAAVLVAAGGTSTRAAGDEPARRTTGLVRKGGLLRISVGAPDLFDEASKQRLFSGFATRVLIRVALHRRDQELPVLLAYQRAEIVYDLWDEHFHLRFVRDDAAETVTEATSADEAIAQATSLWQFPLAHLEELTRGYYFLDFRADLNPLSEDTLNDVRRWLNASGSGARPTSMEGLSRSFVSVFFNPRLDESERQIRFASQLWQELGK